MILLWSVAFAFELQPFRSGDTIESIAAERGSPDAAAEIRRMNGIADGTQPLIGTMLQLPPSQGLQNDQEAFLISLNGNGTFTDEKGLETPAVAWKPIPNNTVVCTDERSTATLRMASTCNEDGSQSDDIVLNPDTCLAVESSVSRESGRSTVVRVTKGAVAVAASKESKGLVTVVTPSGITSGVGGGYRVTIEDEAARTEAIAAPVAVAGGGKQVELDQGQGSRVITGQAPSDPVDLLPAPVPLAPEAGAMLRRLAFSWTPSTDAFAYRFELSSNAVFTQVLTIEDLDALAYTPESLMMPIDGNGSLHWRVSVFDRLGFLGIPSDPRGFTLPPAVLP